MNSKSKSNIPIYHIKSLLSCQSLLIINNFIDLTVTISANDVDLDNEYADLDKSQLGFYINFGNKLLDVLVLSQG